MNIWGHEKARCNKTFGNYLALVKRARVKEFLEPYANLYSFTRSLSVTRPRPSGDGKRMGVIQRPYIIETMHSYTLPM